MRELVHMKKEECKLLLTVKDLQSFLKVGRDTAYALMHSQGFPSMKIGGRYYVSQVELNKWLDRYAYKTYTL